MERRAVLISAVPVGLSFAAALWLVSGGATPTKQVEALQARLAALPRASQARPRLADNASAQILSSPLFDAAAGAMQEVAVRLEGIVRTPGRAAALLSINGGTAQWLDLGQSLGGVSLQGLSASGATIETATGIKDIVLGASIGPSPAGLTPAAGPAPMTPDQPPPGYRGPPPPASAPGAAP